MSIITLKSTKDDHILYEGDFKTPQRCIEAAIEEKIALHHADLSYQNLTNANLDETDLSNADFTGTNLTGANLSECDLHGANFNAAALYNICFAYSNLSECTFEDASFGATDITGCNIHGALFTTLSCFDLDFHLAETMDGCHFRDISGHVCTMNKPPVVIRGLPAGPIIMMDEAIKISGEIAPYSQISETLTKATLLQIGQRS